MRSSEINDPWINVYQGETGNPTRTANGRIVGFEPPDIPPEETPEPQARLEDPPPILGRLIMCGPLAVGIEMTFPDSHRSDAQ